MSATSESLRAAEKRIAEIEKRNATLERENKAWELKYGALEEKYSLLLYKRFCRSAETITEAAQPSLFDEPIPQAPIEEPEAEQVESYRRKKPGRKPLDPAIPRRDAIIDIPESDKVCACGAHLVRIGEETSERLQVIPEQIWVERTIRPKYACRACEGSGDEDRPAVRIADAPASIILSSIASPSLLAFVFTNKYCDHLPYYRQETRFTRIGINISRQNMSIWQQKVYVFLSVLFSLMKEHLKTGPVLRMDETTVQVMNEAGRENTRRSYMWLARGGPPKKPVVLYEYRETRAASHIRSFLEDFSGYLQTDGYEAYETALKAFPAIIHVGCFAHARRYFFEASKALKKAGSAEEAIGYIRKLYAIEAVLREKLNKESITLEQFQPLRTEQCTPVLEKFHAWLIKREAEVPPSVQLGKAIGYSLGQWSKLVRYLESPHLSPDNNEAENAIRPFVLGRKNWLFSGSPDGAKSSCALYSLIETAKANGLNPQAYLLELFERAPLARSEADWQLFLPWNMKVKKSALSA